MRHTNPVPNFRCRSREECNTDIKVGDVVRSYDFERDDSCYIEGRVSKIVPIEGCDRYHIQPTARVWEGTVFPKKEFPPAGYFPPVNGVRVAGTFQYTNGVRKVEQ